MSNDEKDYLIGLIVDLVDAAYGKFKAQQGGDLELQAANEKYNAEYKAVKEFIEVL